MMHSRRLALGSLLMACANIVRTGLQFLMLPLLARLIGPHEYGLFGLAMPVVMLVMSLADGGLGASLAREKSEKTIVWSSAWWILLLIAIVLIPSVIGISYIQSSIVHEPRLPHVIIVLSICLLFFILSVPSGALLFRRGSIGVGAAGEMAAAIIGALLAYILASNGAGVWSLVAQSLSTYGIRFLFQFLAAPYLPELLFSWHAVRPHLLVGGSIVGLKLGDLIERNIENVLIGRAFGTGGLGLYSLATQIPSSIATAVGNIVWTNIYVRALHTTDSRRQAEIYEKFVRLLALILFPITTVGIVEAQAVVAVFMGPQWQGLSPLLEVLLISDAVTALAGIMGAIFLAHGKASLQLRINTETNILRAVVVVFAPQLGLLGCVIGISLTSLYGLARSMAALVETIDITIAQILKAIRGIFVSSLVAALIAFFLSKQLSLPAVWAIVLSGMGGVVAYCCSLMLTDRKYLLLALMDIRRMLRKPPSVA
jgi:O-antigen/teichoic acid export membrane protein